MSLLLLFRRDPTQPSEADTGTAADLETLLVDLLHAESATAVDVHSLESLLDHADVGLTAEQNWVSRITAVPPNQVISATGITITIADIDEDPDSPDGSWAIATGDVDATIAFDSATGTLSAAPLAQEIRIRLRPGS